MPGTNRKVHATVQCHGCEKFGHYLYHCPGDDERQNLNVGDEVEREEEDEEKEVGAQNMQIEEMLDEDVFSSDNGSCLVDFRDF